MRSLSDTIALRRASAWYRQPVLWLGLAILLLSLAGCIWMIVLGARHGDAPLETGRTILGVPETSAPPPPHSP